MVQPERPPANVRGNNTGKKCLLLENFQKDNDDNDDDDDGGGGGGFRN